MNPHPTLQRLALALALVAGAGLAAPWAVQPALAQKADAQTAVALPAGVTRVQSVEGITEYKLANGLKVLLAPDLANDQVTVNLTYLVGARHEGYGETGMAHLLEHLIFKGTPSTPDPKAEFQKRAFNFNGTTTDDRTNYFATFASSQESLDWYLGWQADAMVNSFIAKKDLDTEMPVVRNEFEMGENNPFGALLQRMNRTAYLWHAYGKSVIGARSDIENVDIGRLQAFYKRHYRPDAAVLIVAGKFDVQRTLASVAQRLGAVARPATPVASTYTQEPPQDGERSVVVRRPSPASFIAAIYHLPAALHPDSTALRVLATALGDQPSGRLHKALVEAKLARASFAGANSQREAGMLYVGAVLGPDDEGTARLKLLVDTVEGLAKAPITAEEFDRAKARINKNLELGFANAAAVAQGAMDMEVLGDWRTVFVNRDRMKTVTLDDVNRVARTYLVAANRTTGLMLPETTPQRAPAIEPVDVAAYIKGYAFNDKAEESVAFDFDAQAISSKAVFHTSPGGVRTAVLSKPVRGDVVTVTIGFKHGNLDALKGQSAASVLASRMLDKGTARLNRQQIQDELTRLGVQMGMQFGNNGGGLSVTVKKANLGASLDLVLGVLQEASFPESEFELVRSAEIKSLQGQIADKSSQANNAWSRYGNPYPQDDVRYRHTLEQWLAQVQATTRDQAYGFYKRFYGAQKAQVVVVGPVDAAQVQQQLAQRLDGWKPAVAWVRLPDPLIERQPARLAYDTPDKANVSISAYHAVALGGKKLDPADFAMDMATRIFGGGPGSRLWVALREKGGLSYSAGAHYQSSAYEVNGRLSLSAEVAPQNLKKAEAALQQALKLSLDEGFTVAELASFKQQALAERKSERTGDGWAMGFLYNLLEYGDGPDVYAKGDALTESLTLDQVNDAWRQFVQPQKLVWGVFGDQAKMQ